MSIMLKIRRCLLFSCQLEREFLIRDGRIMTDNHRGGVGINLASADTVIILDPDFNPHQDIQALSRAHRIGQTKKVSCFQLMTRSSAEEKMVQMGRKKMALDHVLIEKMEEENTEIDMESILKHGAADILNDDVVDIRYDEAAVEKLLDRSQTEDTKVGSDNTAESQFSFARVWANDAASLLDSLSSSDEEERVPDPTVWDRILREREQAAAAEATARQQALGRGKRARHVSAVSRRHPQPTLTGVRLSIILPNMSRKKSNLIVTLISKPKIPTTRRVSMKNSEELHSMKTDFETCKYPYSEILKRLREAGKASQVRIRRSLSCY